MGLAQRSKENGRLYDRFRARLMFPLADVRGRVLGFGARALRENQQPKYLNTSDNDVYHKGSNLYGANLARIHATRAGEVILCEGYTDVIALHQAGMQNAVGLMGTALTAEQLGELARMASTLLLALDADSAGREAMLRAQRMASSRKLELRVRGAASRRGSCRAAAARGPEAMSAAVARSIPFVRFQVERRTRGAMTRARRGGTGFSKSLRQSSRRSDQAQWSSSSRGWSQGRLELPESLAEQLLAPRAPRGPSVGGSRARNAARA